MIAMVPMPPTVGEAAHAVGGCAVALCFSNAAGLHHGPEVATAGLILPAWQVTGLLLGLRPRHFPLLNRLA